MVVVSGSGTIGLKLLEGTVLVIVGSGDGSTIVVLLAVTVVVYGRSTGATFLVAVFWNIRRFKRSRIISRDTSGRIGRENISCFHFQ